MTENSFMIKLKDANPKYACIARGMVDYFLTDNPDSSKLRACQEHAYEYAQEVGADVTTKTASPVGKLLRDAGVFEQLPRKVPSHGHTLFKGPNFDEFVEFLEEDADYGTRVRGSEADDSARIELFNYLQKHGAIRANLITNKIPSVQYRALSKSLREGRLDVIFVRPDTTVGVKHDGETKRVKYFVK